MNNYKSRILIFKKITSEKSGDCLYSRLTALYQSVVREKSSLGIISHGLVNKHLPQKTVYCGKDVDVMWITKIR